MPKPNPLFVGVQESRYREDIREFCKRSTSSSGGILLVSGFRGCGKTRLVDEALSDRNQAGRPSLLQRLFGDISDSNRVSVERRPRNIRRTLLRVDVDPFFPHPNLEQDSKKSDEADTNALALAFIRNIVFALTSTIDCRYKSCTHGKTLRDKLGFWQYWFDSNALLHKQTSGCQMHGDYLLFAVFLGLALSAPLFQLWCLMALWIPVMLFLSIGYGGFALLIAWLFLRWRDLHDLKRMSRKLYMLVNSVKSSETQQETRESKSEWASKAPWLLLILLLAASFFGFSIETFTKELDGKESMGLIAAAAVSATATWLFTRKEEYLEEYGKENAAWMINLLRRYLYLCHRCGLEPVLVIDELDKLEELDVWWEEKKQEAEGGKDSATWPRVNRLDQFLLTLCRLKGSLGAEFLWILIGGPPILKRLHQDRHERTDGTLGILATAIQQEIVIGPVSLETALELMKPQPRDQNGNRPLYDEEATKILWLRCRGNFSTMIREIERNNDTNNSPNLDRIANCLENIWHPERQSLLIEYSAYSSPIWREKLENPYTQAWIHAGMMDMANRLLTHEVTLTQIKESFVTDHKEADAIENETAMPELKIIQSGNTNQLLALGKRMIYQFLVIEGIISDREDQEDHQRIYLKF